MDAEQAQAVRIMAAISAAIGTLAAAATLVATLLVQRIKKYPLARCVALHAALILPATLAKLLPEAVCPVAGPLLQAAEFASTVWLAVMAYLAAAVCFFGYTRRREVRHAEWRAFGVVIALSALSLIPSHVIHTPTNAKSSSLYTLGDGWCWFAPQYAEVRLVSLIVPTLLVLVLVVGALVPTVLYVLSAPRPVEPAVYERKMSSLSYLSSVSVTSKKSRANRRCQICSSVRSCSLHLLDHSIGRGVDSHVSGACTHHLGCHVPEAW